ncbi:MAG: hypothetical protein L6Q35_08580 [Phycisphaerales bacterium]|nr:hypothetical protein [Phycisphaerales bacterium]
MERPKLIKVVVAGAALVVAGGVLVYHFTRPEPGTVIAGETPGESAGDPRGAPAPKSEKKGYSRPAAERQGGGYLAPGGG